MKLGNKIHLYSSVVFGALLVIISLTIYFVASNLLIDAELEQSRQNAISAQSGIAGLAGVVEENLVLGNFLPADGMVRLVEENGTTISSVSPSQSQTGLRETAAAYMTTETNEVVEENNQSYTYTVMPVIWSDGAIRSLQFYESLSATESTLAVLRNILIAVTILAMIPVVLSGRLLSSLITKPITSMIQTMKEIQHSGQFKRLELNTESKDELHEMGETFNRMIELLESNFDKQEQFVSNASHELKTPLTVIESYASLLKRRGKNRPDLFDESVEAIHSEAIRMKEMTQQLLLLAKQGEQWNISIEPIDLNKLLAESKGAFENAYQRSVHVTIEEPVELLGDAQKLKQLLFIFLDNAKKYSDDSINLIAGRTGDHVFIRIEDKGIGIPKEDLPKVFDRFYRVDKARNRKSGGSGLGLSLAKEIGDALGAKVELDSLEGIGTTVTIFLPVQVT